MVCCTLADEPSHNYNNVLSVLVGRDEEAFVVHEHFISAKSKFFEAACSERCGGSSRAIKLLETSVRDFELYFHWLYTSKIEVEGEGEEEGRFRDVRQRVSGRHRGG